MAAADTGRARPGRRRLDSEEEAARLLGAPNVRLRRPRACALASDQPRLRRARGSDTRRMGDEAFAAARAGAERLSLEDTIAWIRRARGSRKPPRQDGNRSHRPRSRSSNSSPKASPIPDRRADVHLARARSRSTWRTSSKSSTSPAAPSSPHKRYVGSGERPAGRLHRSRRPRCCLAWRPVPRQGRPLPTYHLLLALC